MSENNQNENLHIGIDVGSTTVKLAILDDADQIRYAVYRRHHADVRATIVEVLSEAARDFGDKRMTIAITGSGGLLLAQWLGIEFVQEVIFLISTSRNLLNLKVLNDGSPGII